jgi:ATP-binding cassette subfamily B (MDR/TAP) protein 1
MLNFSGCILTWPGHSSLIIPFMGFGALMEMKTYMGDTAPETDEDVNSPGSIVVETLLNIRTVASLNLETTRVIEYR